MNVYYGDPHRPYSTAQCYSCSPPPPNYYYPPQCHHERRRYSGCSGWLTALLAFCCGCFIGDHFDTDCCCCIVPCPPCPKC